jgi:hypothetical protein
VIEKMLLAVAQDGMAVSGFNLQMANVSGSRIKFSGRFAMLWSSCTITRTIRRFEHDCPDVATVDLTSRFRPCCKMQGGKTAGSGET